MHIEVADKKPLIDVVVEHGENGYRCFTAKQGDPGRKEGVELLTSVRTGRNVLWHFHNECEHGIEVQLDFGNDCPLAVVKPPFTQGAGCSTVVGPSISPGQSRVLNTQTISPPVGGKRLTYEIRVRKARDVTAWADVAAVDPQLQIDDFATLVFAGWFVAGAVFAAVILLALR